MDAVEGDNDSESGLQDLNSEAMVSDVLAGDGDREEVTREDGEGTLKLVDLPGTKVGVDDVVSEDFAGDGMTLTPEDVEAALTLLSLSGKKVGMDYVYAGLALLDLRRGTSMTLEDYLLTMEQR